MKRMIAFACCWLYLSVACAFTPESGLWAIDAENNGKPGRGFQIDIQGSTFVLTFYGYEASGDAQWYLSAGALSSNAFSGNLEIYEGGMAFGMGQVSAHGTGSAGSVQMTFSDARHGSISLPGEGWKAMSRLNFGRPADPDSLDGTYELTRVVVVLVPSGVFYDSQTNIAATGTMYISGKTAQQSMSLTNDGATTGVSLNGTVTDHGSYMRIVTTQGTVSYPLLIKRGDELITLLALDGGTEVDHWRRVSASGVRKAAHSSADESESTSLAIAPGGGLGLTLGTGTE